MPVVMIESDGHISCEKASWSRKKGTIRTETTSTASSFFTLYHLKK
jgi:hypothetical protein